MSRLTLAIACSTVLLTLGIVDASAAEKGKLQFVAPDKVVLTASDQESSKVSVWLRNTGPSAVVPLFSVVLEDGDGLPIDPTQITVALVDPDGEESAAEPMALSVGDVGRYRLFLKGPGLDNDASGELVAEAAGLSPASVSLSVTPKTIANRGVNSALLIPLVAALILMTIVWLTRANVPWTDRLDTLDLDFKESFASTLTAVGALLGTVISASVLPENTVYLSKQAFTALNLLFGVAVVVAGLVYSAVQKSDWVKKEGCPKRQVRKLQGFVGSFLIACTITVWAVFGELWTLGLLVDELGADAGFTGLTVFIFKFMLLGAALAMALYTFVRVGTIVKGERDTPPGDGGPAPAEGGGSPGPSAPRPRVTLL